MNKSWDDGEEKNNWKIQFFHNNSSMERETSMRDTTTANETHVFTQASKSAPKETETKK